MKTPLICKDCNTEIFVNKNMIMIKDELWFSISKNPEDALCDNCIELKLGRKITEQDFKTPGIPCNEFWLWKKQALITQKFPGASFQII